MGIPVRSGGLAVAGILGGVGNFPSAVPALANTGYSAQIDSPTVPASSDTYVWVIDGSKPGEGQEIGHLEISGCWGANDIASVTTDPSKPVETMPDGTVKVEGLQDDDLPVEVTVVFHQAYPSGHDEATVFVKMGTGPGAGFNLSVGGPICDVADLKIVDQWVEGPAEIPVSQDVDIVVWKVIHNNGPHYVEKAKLTGTPTVPHDCEITPRSHVEYIYELPVSVDISLAEPFTIHCFKPSEHTFEFKNFLEKIKPCYLVDPDMSNNRSEISWTVSAIAHADLQVEQRIIDWPSDINVSESRTVTLETVVTNNGPYGPVAVEPFEPALDPPTDCTAELVTGPFGVNCHPPQEMLGVGESKTIEQRFIIHCSKPSLHTFTFHASVEAKDPHVRDPNTENNEASGFRSVNVWTETDVKILSQELLAGDCDSAAPSEIDVSEDRDICLRKVLHNNGDYGPVDVSVSASASAPSDCSAIPHDGNPTRATLPVSDDVVVEEVWAIHCEKASEHTFSFDNSIEITTPHVRESDPSNNVALTEELTVTVIAEADLKVTGISVTGPSEIDVSETEMFTVFLTLHNNGPYGPVEVLAPALNVVPPPDCTYELLPCLRLVDLQVNESRTVDCGMEIHCEDPSSHTFEARGFVEPGTHVTDFDGDNNSAEIDLDVIATTETDVKIVSQEVLAGDCVSELPSDIDVGQEIDFCLHKTLHSNGGFGPVDVSITASPTVPSDCTAVPDLANPTTANLPVGTDVVVDEIWTISCSDPCDHPFSFDNTIEVTTAHVEDPTPANDSASTDVIVTFWAEADVEITGQSFVNPPSEIPPNQDVDVTLRKNVRNNGPYGPVDISISSSAKAPANCTVDPSSQSPPDETDVAVGEERTVDEN